MRINTSVETRPMIKTLCSEIDDSLGTASGTSQTKWKNLRDRFVQKHTLQCTYIPNGSAAVKKRSNWTLYESLRFLAPIINYRKTKSNIENVHPNVHHPRQKKKGEFNFSSVPSMSSKERNNISQQSIAPQSSLLKSQSKQNSYSRPNSANSDIESKKKVPVGTKRGNSTTDSTRSIPDSEVSLHSPLPPKRVKKSRTVENIDTRLEEAILTELKQTRPTNEVFIKVDKIESFTKYLEACLRGMPSDVSKRVINKTLQLILQEDI